ncbi:MAG: adventurous gliding motility protein CglE [Rhodobacterales bacterium]|nr:adventurous gliding motility protein CglE [Rhodobacterales bacterium]
MRTALLIALTLFGTHAQAQDLDSDRGSSKKGAKTGKDEVVREVNRGMYMKAGAGSSQFIGTASGLLRPVVGLNMSAGQDFVDLERLSVAWEVNFAQALHNGPKVDELGGLPSNLLVEGDIHTFSGIAFIEVSSYLTRRFSLGIRGGAGITMVPVLMDATAFADEVELGIWGQASGVHAGPLPTFGGGPTIEYYTKLSHFSVGADIDVLYMLGLDLALNPNGYLKYTF